MLIKFLLFYYKDLNWRKLSDFSPEIIAKARAFLDKNFVTDPEGNYIHVKPTKIESVKIHDKPAKPLKVKSTENLRALMVALSNQKAVSKNSIIIKPN